MVFFFYFKRQSVDSEVGRGIKNQHTEWKRKRRTRLKRTKKEMAKDEIKI